MKTKENEGTNMKGPGHQHARSNLAHQHSPQRLWSTINQEACLQCGSVQMWRVKGGDRVIADSGHSRNTESFTFDLDFFVQLLQFEPVFFVLMTSRKNPDKTDLTDNWHQTEYKESFGQKRLPVLHSVQHNFSFLKVFSV